MFVGRGRRIRDIQTSSFRSACSLRLHEVSDDRFRAEWLKRCARLRFVRQFESDCSADFAAVAMSPATFFRNTRTSFKAPFNRCACCRTLLKSWAALLSALDGTELARPSMVALKSVNSGALSAESLCKRLVHESIALSRAFCNLSSFAATVGAFSATCAAFFALST